MDKTRDIHFRVDEETNSILESKIKASNMGKSEFMRQMIVNGQVNPITNGKEIAQKLGLVHQNMLNYHNDVVDHFQTLQSVVAENKQLLSNRLFMTNSEVMEALQMQNLRITAIANTLMTNYSEEERKAEDKMHNLIQIVTVERR